MWIDGADKEWNAVIDATGGTPLRSFNVTSWSTIVAITASVALESVHKRGTVEARYEVPGWRRGAMVLVKSDKNGGIKGAREENETKSGATGSSALHAIRVGDAKGKR